MRTFPSFLAIAVVLTAAAAHAQQPTGTASPPPPPPPPPAAPSAAPAPTAPAAPAPSTAPTPAPTPTASPPPPAPSAPSAPPAPSAPAAAGPSLGDSLSGPAKSDYDTARMLFGVSDYAGALIKFTSAYATSKDPRLLWEMATCESKLHHYAKSLGYMRRYVQEGAALLSDQDKADAGAAIKAMEPLTSTLTVNVTEPGADVYLDADLVGPTPIAPFLIDIGEHKVTVRKPGFQDFTADLTVTGGAQVSVDARLAPIVHEGKLTVRAGPQDTIAIDGLASAVGSWSGPLKSGGHTLRVTSPGMTPYQTEIVVQDGQARDIDVTLNPEPRSSLLPTWAWITGGVVLAGGLGVGAYFLFKPSPQYSGPQGNIGPGVIQANAPIHF